ncbi:MULTISPECIES: hypothetical protein [Deinococcus]|uniref:MarR family transcriptional regulator n=1 Tax=Deinococcus rufus TaxID=2136097 RepID=A0ABV7ZBI7_9DEIO|nr:hypothetical protein [Deinococcus sp. AB2017081]WQE94074.1 hypothetical protein U2P90_11705 [Deinococcus sp. AB2017081]
MIRHRYRPQSARARVLHVFTLYTVVDALLLARALNLPYETVVMALIDLHRHGRVLRAPEGNPRRRAVRVAYHREIR